MSGTLKYKDYQGCVEFSEEDGILFGQVLMIDSLITYQGSSVQELTVNFQAAVDDYLAYCEKKNISPNKAYSGSFNVRLKPESHRALAQVAILKKVSLNDIVKQACDQFLEDSRKVIINHHTHSHNHFHQIAEEQSEELEIKDWKGTSKGNEWQLESTLKH